MRGKANPQPELIAAINLEQRVPKDHPLREIKRSLDEVLSRLGPEFDGFYKVGGRPSVPPEVLLKSKVLIALYSVRSERLFCEQLGYNLLWLWFLDREVEEGGFDHSLFSHHADGVLGAAMSERFFDETYRLSQEGGWTSNDHFSADGSLIEAWASAKSFRPKGEDDEGGGDGNGFKPSNPDVDFHGERRGNATHESRTDPESVLYRKGRGKEAKLSFGLHSLMENRNGFIAELDVHNPISEGEPEMALRQLDRIAEKGKGEAKTAGADKGYHTKEFVGGCRGRGTKPHVAQVKGRRTPGMDGRTTSSRGYVTSQRIRKRAEEFFGWVKTVGGLRKARHRGREKIGACAHIAGGTYNLIRLANLSLAAP